MTPEEIETFRGRFLQLSEVIQILEEPKFAALIAAFFVLHSHSPAPNTDPGFTPFAPGPNTDPGFTPFQPGPVTHFEPKDIPSFQPMPDIYGPRRDNGFTPL